MLEFISETPPESAFLLGLTTGALISKTIRSLIEQRFASAIGSAGPVPEED